LTNTKIKDYYNTFSIEKDNISSYNLQDDNVNISSTSLNDLNNINNINNDNMKDELNDFLQKIKS
jgi:nitrate reductase beta subunit